MGLPVLGFVLSSPDPTRDVSTSTNAAAITGLTGLACLAELPHLGDPDAAVLDSRVFLPAKSRILDKSPW